MKLNTPPPEVGFVPTYVGSTALTDYESACVEWSVDANGLVTMRGTCTFRADAHTHDQAQRLRYPPKEAARGSVSRRREKLRKAGVRR